MTTISAQPDAREVFVHRLTAVRIPADREISPPLEIEYEGRMEDILMAMNPNRTPA